jgi:hypothetical protein
MGGMSCWALHDVATNALCTDRITGVGMGVRLVPPVCDLCLLECFLEWSWVPTGVLSLLNLVQRVLSNLVPDDFDYR